MKAGIEITKDDNTTEIYLHLTNYPTMNKLRQKIKKCENQSYVQQVVYSTYHDGLTQVCFNCETVRTTIADNK